MSTTNPDQTRLVTKVKPRPFNTSDQITRMLHLSPADYYSGRYRIMLYRYLTDQIPVINACIWTWARLAAAPGQFVAASEDDHLRESVATRLASLTERLYTNATGNRTGIANLLPELFTSLFRDGITGGFITVLPDGSGIDRFIPVDSVNLRGERTPSGPRLLLDSDTTALPLDRADFYYLALTSSPTEPFGRSILQAVPFIAYIEQQLVQDLQRAQRNAGYNRLHVKITPPERMAGESDNAYTDRINKYFDATVEMIRSCDVDDNPVTWNNVAIEYIGAEQSRGMTNNWFINHRAIIEDICAGTNLAPYMLGYSYGATTTWSNFKFDIVMRQIRTVQAEMANFLEWIANIDLALAGIDASIRFVFDNTFAYQAADQIGIESKRVDNLLKLYEAGLIDQKTACEKAWNLL